ncbi:hypothetical protein ACXX4F_28270 [Bacillus cereus]
MEAIQRKRKNNIKRKTVGIYKLTVFWGFISAIFLKDSPFEKILIVLDNLGCKYGYAIFYSKIYKRILVLTTFNY